MRPASRALGGLDASVEHESTAVEYAFGDAEGKSLLSEFLTNLGCCFGLGNLCGILDIRKAREG